MNSAVAISGASGWLGTETIEAINKNKLSNSQL
jgi:hypothetical protein